MQQLIHFRSFITTLWLTISVALLPSIATAAKPDESALDSIYKYTYTNFPKAQRLMKQLREVRAFPQHRLDITEGDLYYNNAKFHHALRYYHNALKSDSVLLSNKLYMAQIHRLISCYDMLYNHTRKMVYIKLLRKKAEECGDTAMQSVAIFNIGKAVYQQGDKEAGYNFMKQAVEVMKTSDYAHKYDNLRYNYNTMLVFQQNDNRHTEALETLEALRTIISTQGEEQVSMQGLIEKEIRTLNAHSAVTLNRLGRTAEAEEYYIKWHNATHPNDRTSYLITPYLFDRKRYDEVIAMNAPREREMVAESDTVTYQMCTIKKSLGRAYAGKGDYKIAARYFEQLATLRDSLKRREQLSAANQLNTVYETYEKEQLQYTNAAEARLRTTIQLCGGIIVLLGAALLWAIYRITRLRRRNLSLAQTIVKQHRPN